MRNSLRFAPRSAPILGAIALSALLGGCVGAGGEGDSVDEKNDAVVSENANDKVAFDFFIGKGLTPVQAAGIVGNLDQESSMSPTVWQYGGGPGRGIAQWSAGGRWDADAHDNVAWYASTQGASEYSLNLQLEFIWYELTTFGYGFSKLRAATTVTAATEAFQDYYEICGACDSSNRIAHAQAALNDFGSDGASPPPPPQGPPTSVPPKPSGCGHIAPGEGLSAGESFESCDGRFSLAMQTDGNLVVYRGSAGALWSTGTSGSDGYVAVMQGDGNFVLYGKHSNALWSSKTNGHGGASLDLQTDGNLVVYSTSSSPLWASGTNVMAAPPAPSGCTIAPGQGLTAGTQVESCDGRYTFAMQSDGNLVLYHNGVGALWSTGTNGKNGFNAIMQGDGNFVLYDTKGHALWSSGTSGHGGADLAVQEDGNVVVYLGTKPLWDTGTNGR